MGKYKIEFRKSAIKELEKINKFDLRRIVKKISILYVSSRPEGSQKLADHKLYRIRQGNYRIVYSIDDDKSKIQIVKIGHRKEIYRF